jgi:hypothetical protein
MAMIVTSEFDYLLTACGPACQPNGAHRSFGSATDQSNFFNRWDGIDNKLSQFRFASSGSPETGPLLCCFLDCVDHNGMGVAQNHWSPTADVVEIMIAIDVYQEWASTALHKQWMATDSAECTGGTVDSTWHQTTGPFKGLATFFKSILGGSWRKHTKSVKTI